MDGGSPRSPERYLDVRALLLRWKGADKAFYEQLISLKNVLQDEYRFNIEDWAIPHDDPFFQLSGRLYQFLQSDDSDTLLILYYGGHGSTDTDRNALWMCYDRADSPKLSWSSLQPLFFNKKSDILMIFDCCSAGSAVCAPGEGVVEGVFASGVGGRTPLSGKGTFTKNLVDRLRKSDCFNNGITAYRLYHDLAQNFKLSNDNTKQQGVSPHYLRLAERQDEFRTIQLARLPSFYTAMSGTSVKSAVTRRTMSVATARSNPTLEIIDMAQGCERVGLPIVPETSSTRSLNMSKMSDSDTYSIRHSVFRGCDKVSDQLLPWHRQEGTQTEIPDAHLGQSDYSSLADRSTGLHRNPLLGRNALLTSRTPTNDEDETATGTSNLEIQGNIEAIDQIDRTTFTDEVMDKDNIFSVDDVPQNQRLMADLLCKRSTPLPTLKFDSGSSGYGYAMNPVREDNYKIWTQKSSTLLFNADREVSAARRVFLELRAIQTSRVPFISAAPLEDSLDTVLASIEGPPDTPYESGIFWISVEFEPQNPAAPPALRFQTKVYHPNIDCQGKICADYESWWKDQNLKRYMNFMTNVGPTRAWFSESASNRYSLGALLTALCGLLASPNVQDPLVPEIAETYIRDYAGYCKIAKSYTAKYAMAERPSTAAIRLARDSLSMGNRDEYQIKSQSAMSSTVSPALRVGTSSIASSRLDQWEQERQINADEAKDERLVVHEEINIGLITQLIRSGYGFNVTDEVLKAAAGNRDCNEEIMHLLLDQRGGGIPITEEILKAAAGNTRYGKEVMQLILDQKGGKIAITEELLKAIVENRDCGKEIMDFLPITEETLKAMVSNANWDMEIMKLLFDRKGNEIIVTEGVVIAAARNFYCGTEVMKFLLDRKGDVITITEAVVKAAVENSRHGLDIMTLLLDQKGDQVVITENVLKAAAGNRYGGKGVMALLLDQKGDQTVITEEVLKAAARNWTCGKEVMAMLLDRKGHELGHK